MLTKKRHFRYVQSFAMCVKPCRKPKGKPKQKSRAPQERLAFPEEKPLKMDDFLPPPSDFSANGQVLSSVVKLQEQMKTVNITQLRAVLPKMAQ